MLNKQDRQQLKEIMVNSFNLNELYELCFDLAVEVENFSLTQTRLCMDIITFHERRKILGCLLREIRIRRLNIPEVEHLLQKHPYCIQITKDQKEEHKIQYLKIISSQALDQARETFTQAGQAFNQVKQSLSKAEQACDQVRETLTQTLIQAEKNLDQSYEDLNSTKPLILRIFSYCQDQLSRLKTKKLLNQARQALDQTYKALNQTRQSCTQAFHTLIQAEQTLDQAKQAYNRVHNQS